MGRRWNEPKKTTYNPFREVSEDGFVVEWMVEWAYGVKMSEVEAQFYRIEEAARS